MKPPAAPTPIRRLYIPNLEVRLRGVTPDQALARARGLAPALGEMRIDPGAVGEPNALAQRLARRIAAALRKE